MNKKALAKAATSFKPSVSHLPEKTRVLGHIPTLRSALSFEKKSVAHPPLAQSIQRVPCHNCLLPIQAKLTINKPGDQYEQEADRVADQVMRMPEHKMQRQMTAKENHEKTSFSRPQFSHIFRIEQTKTGLEEEQKKGIQNRMYARDIPSISLQKRALTDNFHGGGQPLPESEKRFFERRFGYNFDQVRVHSYPKAAESAQSFNARAYTVGHNIVFGAGQYAYGSNEGRRLLAHELAHVIQNRHLEASTVIRRKEDPQGENLELMDEKFNEAFERYSELRNMYIHMAFIAASAKPSEDLYAEYQAYTAKFNQAQKALHEWLFPSSSKMKLCTELVPEIPRLKRMTLMWEEVYNTVQRVSEGMELVAAEQEAIDAEEALNQAKAHYTDLKPVSKDLQLIFNVTKLVAQAERDVRLSRSRLNVANQQVKSIKSGRSMDIKTRKSTPIHSQPSIKDLLRENVEWEDYPAEKVLEGPNVVMSGSKEIERSGEGQREKDTKPKGTQILNMFSADGEKLSRYRDFLLRSHGIDLPRSGYDRWNLLLHAFRNITGGIAIEIQEPHAGKGKAIRLKKTIHFENPLQTLLCYRSQIEKYFMDFGYRSKDGRQKALIGQIGTYSGHGPGSFDISVPSGLDIKISAPKTLDLSHILGGEFNELEFKRSKVLGSKYRSINEKGMINDVYAKLATGLFGMRARGKDVSRNLEEEHPKTSPNAERLLAGLDFTNITTGELPPDVTDKRDQLLRYLNQRLWEKICPERTDKTYLFKPAVEAGKGSPSPRLTVSSSELAGCRYPPGKISRPLPRRSTFGVVINVTNMLLKNDGEMLKLTKTLLNSLRAAGASGSLGGPSFWIDHFYEKSGEENKSSVMIRVSYVHLYSAATKKEIKEITPETVIGITGSTGNAVTAHVHTQIRVYLNNRLVGFLNPMDFFPALKPEDRRIPKKCSIQC